MKYQIIKFFRCYAAIAVAGLLFVACAEEERITYYDPDAPAPVSLDRDAISVKNLPGKAVITYKVPDDKNLLYVQAEYETAPGMVRTAQTSLYCDTLLLEGFGKSDVYAVKLFSVGKNEKRSEPVEVDVWPSTPPVLEAFPTINLEAVFGGVRGTFVNLHKSELKLSLLADTVGDGRYTLLRSFTTNQLNASFAYLNLPSKESDFACYIQDRWGNRSDTVFFDDITPRYEMFIDKEKWTWLKLPSDNLTFAEMGAGNRYSAEKMWDGINPATWEGYVTENNILPFSLTVRLGGEPVILSRIVIYQARMWEYDNFPKRFQIYGSNADNPADNIRDADWTLLGYFEAKLPSGQSAPTPSDEETLKNDGAMFFFEITDNIPNPYLPTKFVRFLFLENGGGKKEGATNASILIGEIDLFGTLSE